MNVTFSARLFSCTIRRLKCKIMEGRIHELSPGSTHKQNVLAIVKMFVENFPRGRIE